MPPNKSPRERCNWLVLQEIFSSGRVKSPIHIGDLVTVVYTMSTLLHMLWARVYQTRSAAVTVKTASRPVTIQHQ